MEIGECSVEDDDKKPSPRPQHLTPTTTNSTTSGLDDGAATEESGIVSVSNFVAFVWRMHRYWSSTVRKRLLLLSDVHCRPDCSTWRDVSECEYRSRGVCSLIGCGWWIVHVRRCSTWRVACHPKGRRYIRFTRYIIEYILHRLHVVYMRKTAFASRS